MTSPSAVVAARVETGAFAVVDLSAHFNNDGISHLDPVPDGDLNGEGMAFPADVLPPSNQVVELCGIRFLFPDKESGADNNVCLDGQVVAVPPGKYRELHVLGVSEGGSFEERCGLHYASSRVDEARLGLTDCRPPWCEVRFEEQVALRFDEMHFPAAGEHGSSAGQHRSSAGQLCGMWIQTLRVDREETLRAVELGDNPSMHIFAMTLRRGTDGASGTFGSGARKRSGRKYGDRARSQTERMAAV